MTVVRPFPRAAARAVLALLLASLTTLLWGVGAASAAPTGTSPIGNLEGAAAVTGGVEVRGWALDPETSGSIYVWVTLDGVGRHVLAGQDRPDVAAAFGLGAAHGFRATLSAGPGSHRVCVTASNVGVGSHTPLGCRTVTVPDTSSPVGNVEAVGVGTGAVTVKGWALDPDTTGSIYVWVSVGSSGRHLIANQERPDVAAAYPGKGSAHGFQGTVAAGPGTQRVCVTAVNVGTGVNKVIGCRSVTVPDNKPVGNIESVTTSTGAISLKGWALDRDTSGSIYLWVTLDGAGRHWIANVNRPDIAAAFPGLGANHGFQGTLGASAGRHTVCVTALNVGPGANTSLGCATVTVPGTTGGGGTPPRPSSPDLDCADFATQAAAQAAFNYWYPTLGDVYNLDGDGDLRVCESLP